MTTIKRKYWQGPSGRIHLMRRCSGAAPVSRMKAVHLTREQWEASERCRCAMRSEGWDRLTTPQPRGAS